jgi:hypothetical protein
MFHQLLRQSIEEGEAITHAISQIGVAITAEPVLTAYVDAARQAMSNPEHILRLIVPNSGTKTSPWW